MLKLKGSEILDMRHGFYHALKLLDGTKIEDDTKMADRLRISTKPYVPFWEEPEHFAS
ncbi:hypothetical protein GCM10022289_21060 [Pedobacter jeongneungensis]|uniref:Uncharacterized protein n=1 Tax=Pedobacter jeongneungensis TaxID=947309 RepID=A0ABP8BD19_9SPHI